MLMTSNHIAPPFLSLPRVLVILVATIAGVYTGTLLSRSASVYSNETAAELRVQPTPVTGASRLPGNSLLASHEQPAPSSRTQLHLEPVASTFRLLSESASPTPSVTPEQSTLRSEQTREPSASSLQMTSTLPTVPESTAAQFIQYEDFLETPGWPDRRKGEGYIHCYASSGLADSLNQLWRCADVADRLQYTRVFFEMPMYKATRLSEVFDISHFPIPLSIGRSVKQHIAALYARGELEGSPYKLPFLAYSSFEKPINPRTLLIMHVDNGGNAASGALRHLSLGPSLLAQWLSLRARFPLRYTSVHVRNTDMKASEVDFDALIHEAPADLPIVLVTDDDALIERVTKRWPAILHSPSHRSSNGGGLHYQGSLKAFILPEAILDMLLLASCEKLIVMRGINQWGAGISGFSKLAIELNSCQSILQNFVYGTSNISLETLFLPCAVDYPVSPTRTPTRTPTISPRSTDFRVIASSRSQVKTKSMGMAPSSVPAHLKTFLKTKSLTLRAATKKPTKKPRRASTTIISKFDSVFQYVCTFFAFFC